MLVSTKSTRAALGLITAVLLLLAWPSIAGRAARLLSALPLLDSFGLLLLLTQHPCHVSGSADSRDGGDKQQQQPQGPPSMHHVDAETL